MIIAVELDPPVNNADSSALRFLIEGAERLRDAGADYLTVADNPRAMARSDSVATAALLSALSGVPVTPHLTARDRNELSLKSAIAAMDLAGLRETLVVTGDPFWESTVQAYVTAKSLTPSTSRVVSRHGTRKGGS